MPIALLTDFGTKDYFVGAMKGSILTIDPQACIIDITHEIEPRNVAAAAFILRSCFRDFPAGAIFVCVVDPGVGSVRRPIATQAHDRVFIAPDNGLLSLVIVDDPAMRAFKISNPIYLGKHVSNTFHGRDIFAPAAAYVSMGVPVNDLGPSIADIVSLDFVRPVTNADGSVTGEIIHVDRFGNLVTNLELSHLGEYFVLEIDGHRISELKTAYADSTSNEPFLIEGSAGFVEISCRNASAANRLGVVVGMRIIIVSESHKV